jgi:diguanylate cyclase (GGDEF)-like protein
VIGLVIVHLETRLRDARAMATLDPLTGVFNRTEMQVRVERAIEKARNGGPNLSFIYIDCDRFKEVNDTHGHAFGDHVLRALAGMLQSAVQHQGIVGRMGGDEFVALFEGVSEADARARMQVAELRFTRDMRSLGCHTTMSFGLVPVGAEAMTFQSLLEEADHRMYAQKQEGALAVVSAGDPVRYLPDVGAVLFEEHGFGA